MTAKSSISCQGLPRLGTRLLKIQKRPIVQWYATTAKSHAEPEKTEKKKNRREKKRKQELHYQTCIKVNTLMLFVLTYSPIKKREGNWSRNASQSCFWDRYWGSAGQRLANVFPLSSVTVPEVFAKVNSFQSPSRFYSNDLLLPLTYSVSLACSAFPSVTFFDIVAIYRP